MCKETVRAFQSSERDPEIRKRRDRPHPASKANRRAGGEEAGCTLCCSGPTLQAAMGPGTPLLILLLLSWSGPLQGQQHHLVEYMERRLAALEVRDSFPAQPGRIPHLLLVQPVCQGSGDDEIGLCKNLQKILSFNERILKIISLPLCPHRTVAKQTDLCILPARIRGD